MTYHGAWRLRLVEDWLLFFVFPSIARDYVLSSVSFSRLLTLRVWSLVLCSQSFCPSPLAACGWDAVVLSPCAYSPVRDTVCGQASRGEALFPRTSSQRLHVVTGLVFRSPSLASRSLGS